MHQSDRQKARVKSGRLISKFLVVLTLLSLTLFTTACSTGVLGTYRAASDRATISASGLEKSRGNRITCSIDEFTLHEDGSVTTRHSSFGYGGKEKLSGGPTGRYAISGEKLTLTFDGEPIPATFHNGSVIFDTKHGGPPTYKKAVVISDAATITLLIIWAAIATIQGFLAYGLAARDARRDKENITGASLYFSLALYELAALVPGLVIFLWFHGRKKRHFI